MKTELIIGDGTELVRFGLERLFGDKPNVNLRGSFSDGKALVQFIQKEGQNNRVVLIDFTSPGFSIDTVLQLKTANPDLRIVAITPDQNSQTIVTALKAGVMSYIKKDCDIQEILDAVKDSGEGNAFFCGKILEAIAGEDINLESIQWEPLDCSPITLSKREIEIICLIAEGLTNGQIAEKLVLSLHTINTHRKNIMAKLGVNNTAAIVMYAIKAQLVSPNKYLFSKD